MTRNIYSEYIYSIFSELLTLESTLNAEHQIQY